MPIESKNIPYEYLVRFDGETVQGQHIRRLTRLVDSKTGEVLAEREGDPLPVGHPTGGVMLETALGEVGAALARAEELERARRVVAEQQRDEAAEARDEARAERDAARAEVARLIRERDERGPPANGSGHAAEKA